jgi:hypothetical protein
VITKDIYAQANEELRCDHAETALRRRTLQVGGQSVHHAWRQCLRCGKNLGAQKMHPLGSVRVADLEPFDEQLPALWQQRWRARLEELRRQQQAQEAEEWWSHYEAYLQTAAWQDRRRRVLERDGYVCQGCQGGSGLRATQAHHLTYEHVGEEFLWELVAVCMDCHARLHPRAHVVNVVRDAG